jgi:hypothetical protein
MLGRQESAGESKLLLLMLLQNVMARITAATIAGTITVTATAISTNATISSSSSSSRTRPCCLTRNRRPTCAWAQRAALLRSQTEDATKVHKVPENALSSSVVVEG